MSITIEAIEAKQTELGKLIEQFRAQAMRGATLQIAGIVLELAPGEHYAGAVLNDDGTVKHHLVLMAKKPSGSLDWPDAMAWAESVGGSLPARKEQALLYANCKPHLAPEWHWSSETNGESYAWYCDFGSGHQICSHRSAEGSAVAVRRFIP